VASQVVHGSIELELSGWVVICSESPHRKCLPKIWETALHNFRTFVQISHTVLYNIITGFQKCSQMHIKCRKWLQFWTLTEKSYPVGPVWGETMQKSMLRFCVYQTNLINFKTIPHIQISNTRFKRARMKECHATLTLSA
jgi:hypothetical protein